MKKGLFTLATLAVLIPISSNPALAYVGPGLGLGVIGAILGVIFSILLAIFAIFWYPIKRKLGNRKKAKKNIAPTIEQEGQEEQDNQ